MSRIARFLLTLTSISAAVLANAQGTFQLFPTLESPVGELTPQTAVLRFTQNVTLMDYGIRVSPANGVAQIRMSTQPGSPLSASQGEAIWQGGPFFVGSRAVLRPLVQMKPDFVGTATITFFARTPGTTTDLISSSVVVSVGQLPAPTMAVPIANETISPAPAFRGQLATVYPQTASYQVEVTGPTNRTFTIPAGATNADFTHYTAYDAGYQPGDYTWRIRAIDARGRAGIWSAPRSNRIFGGIDMAGLGTQAFFNSMRAAGWSTYFAAAWGGRNIWSPAAQNLQRANAAGMKVAAYAFLNFDNSSTIAGAPANQTGQWQVDQGLRACGYVGTKASLPFDLKYFMIDIENSYVGTMAPVDRAQRIAEAVQHARNLGFWPMIYTRNEGFNQWWNDYTGSSRDFRELWLWDSKPETATAVYKDHLPLNLGVPWIRYGGWEERGGKQYYLDVTILGHRVDFNVWDPAVWNVNSPNPGSINISPANITMTRTATNSYKAVVTLRNTGNIEAYAVRLGDANLGGQAVSGRQTLGLITPSGSRSGTYTFPSSAGTPGTQALLNFTVWTGNGPQNHQVWVNLP